jgi:A/G-specific adenine glycosylase
MDEPMAGPGDDLARFREALLDYFARGQRELPWRETDDPYRILVSEIMLQQTRVETVVPYYRRWIERFPDAASLAGADEEEVLLHWKGLGYYRRARSLLGAARAVVAEHGGVVPGDAATLETLPGVGPYTAGAVASIAFGEPVPAVDGNVRRVLSRILDDPDPSAARLRSVAGRLVDPERPGDFNQALMELGATICTPRRARCGGCPVRPWCAAAEAGTVDERPARRPRREVPRVVEGVAVVLDGADRVLLRRRPLEGLLGGMWECAGEEITAPLPRGRSGEHALIEAVLRVARGLPEIGAEGAIVPVALLPPVEHAFTHRKVTYRPVLLRVNGSRGRPGEGAAQGVERPVDAGAPRNVRWVSFDELDGQPLSRAQERILEEARARLGDRVALRPGRPTGPGGGARASGPA